MKKLLSMILLITVLLSSYTFPAFAADEIVITTADELCTREGSWLESTNEKVAGPLGGTSWYASSKEAKAIYDASGLAKGNYGVYIYMTPFGTTADKVDVTITASGKSETLTIDAMHGGVGKRHWLYLGKYDFNGSAGDGVSQQINANAEKANGSAANAVMRASGVKFVKDDANTSEPETYDNKVETPAGPTTSVTEEGIIITAADALCSRTGSGWLESSNVNVAGPLGGTSWYTSDKNATAEYDASGLEKGSYGVYLYMTPWGTTADKVDVTITASGKATTLLTSGVPDSKQGARRWLYLGKYDFDGSIGDGLVQKINPEAELGLGEGDKLFMRTSAVKFLKDDPNTGLPEIYDEFTGGATSSEPVEITYTTVPEVGSVVMGTEHPSFKKKGSWKESGILMPVDGSAYYTSAVGATAEWQPHIAKAENVEIFYLKPNATNTEDAGLELEVFAGGETKTITIDFTQPPSEWYSLGRYNFSGNGEEYIRIKKVTETGTARITCLKFAIVDDTKIVDDTASAFFGTDLHIVERMGMLIGEGDGITEEYLKKVPTRVQAAIMVLRLNGVDAEAAAFAGTDNFADASLEAWASAYLAYLKANPQFGLIGTGDNLFEPTANIDEQAYAKILLTALGYEYNVDFTWDETLEFAKEKGIAKAESDAFTVKDLAIMTESVLNLNCKDGTPYLEKLILERDGVVDEGVYGTELPAELKAARDAAKNKKRGIIYNNDGNDVYKSYPEYPGAYDISHLDGTTINTENFLKTRSYGIEDTQVGSVFYCTGVFNSYTQESTGITDVRVRDWSRALKEYTGKDSLTTMVDYIHSVDKEIFWSMRMNDTHDYKYKEHELDPWKQANMDLLMYRKNDAAFMKFGANRWTSVDYTLPEVRQVVYDIFKDVITRYDVDGLELDLTRWPIFFKEQTQGYDIYPENTERMNNLVRMIRDLTEKISIERGKPILLAVYAPDSMEFCKAIGCDIETWLKEDLIDIVSINCHSGSFQTWEDGIAEYKDYDVQVYAALDPLGYDEKRGLDDYEIDKNEAALAYAAGADGIYTYNYFTITHERFDTLGSPETCGPVDPGYVSAREVYNGRLIKDGEKYVKLPK